MRQNGRGSLEGCAPVLCFWMCTDGHCGFSSVEGFSISIVRRRREIIRKTGNEELRTEGWRQFFELAPTLSEKSGCTHGERVEYTFGQRSPKRVDRGQGADYTWSFASHYLLEDSWHN